MDAILSHVLHGSVYGGIVGAGMGLLSAVCIRSSPTDQPRYLNPRSKRWRVLDTLSIETGIPLESYVTRLWKTLCLDPSSSDAAREQYHISIYQLQRFLVCLHQNSTVKEVIRFRVLIRKQSLVTLRSLGRLTALCSGCREVEEIYRFVGEIQTFVQTAALKIDR